MRKIFTILFFVCNLFANAQQIPEKPSPIIYVNDYAAVLSAEIKTELENNLRAFAEKTSTVFVISTINSSGIEDIESFSLNWAEKWGIGKKNQNNGIFFLVAVQDRKMRIEVGYGLESELTDAESKSIINSIKPDFKNNNFNSGITKAAFQIIKQLDSTFNFKSALPNLNSDDSGLRKDLLPAKPVDLEKIIDLDNLLTDSEESDLNQVVKLFHKKNIKFKTILVKNFSRYSTKGGPSVYINFAYDINRYWDLAPSSDKESVLLLIQTDNVDNYGTNVHAHGSYEALGKDFLFDSLRIINSELRGFIKQNELKKGIQQAVNRVGGLIKKNKDASDWEFYTFIFYLILGLAIFIGIGVYFSGKSSGNRRSSYGYGGSSYNNYSGYRNSYSDSYSDSSYSNSSSSYSDYGGGSFGGGGASGDW